MINNLIRVAVVGVVLILLYYLAAYLAAALGAPHIVLVLVTVLLVLVFIGYLASIFVAGDGTTGRRIL